jgi:DNA adenine methylase
MRNSHTEPGPEPFLRWPGGKTWLVNDARRLFGQLRPKKYFEPFLGSGAVFFALKQCPAVLSDINQDLVDTYVVVRDRSAELIQALQAMDPTREAYYRVRAASPFNEIEKAARFLYLNRMGFNGIYRVNQRGEFNVPYGGADRRLDYFWRSDRLIRASRALQESDIHAMDFAKAMSDAGAGDLIYCDPVYLGAGPEESFARYTDTPFNELDFRRLTTQISLAVGRGAFVALSWPHEVTPAMRDGQVDMHLLARSSTISAKAKSAEKRCEKLFLFRPSEATAQTSLIHRAVAKAMREPRLERESA